MKQYDNSSDSYRQQGSAPRRGGFIGKHPVLANFVIIVVVAVLGAFITYLSLALFTKQGESDTVPSVVNTSYGTAVEKLHDAGFKVEIKDSVYFNDVKPGVVVDQFPAAGAVVKPGRKVYLYINALHPKEVIIDGSGDTRQPALRGFSMRQAQAQLQELGFTNIKVEYVLGDTDRVLRVTADGQIVRKMQKVPLNAKIVLTVYDGRKSAIADSLVRVGGVQDLDEQTQYENYEYSGTDEGEDPEGYTEFEETFLEEHGVENNNSLE